jgi:hypothetical protein
MRQWASHHRWEAAQRLGNEHARGRNPGGSDQAPYPTKMVIGRAHTGRVEPAGGIGGNSSMSVSVSVTRLCKAWDIEHERHGRGSNLSQWPSKSKRPAAPRKAPVADASCRTTRFTKVGLTAWFGGFRLPWSMSAAW